MTKFKKPAIMDRREFLEFAGSGLLLAMVSSRAANAATADEATFASDGFSLTIHFPPGGAAQVSSLHNPKTDFQWVRANTQFEPVFTVAKKPSQKWISLPGTRKHHADGDRLEFISRSDRGEPHVGIALQIFTDAPILEIQAEFQNASKAPFVGVTSFGPFRFALRDDMGPLRVHAIRRNEYGLKSIPFDGLVDLSGGRWNAPEYAGLILLEAVGKGEFLLVGIEWERGWRYRIEKDTSGTWLSVDIADLAYDMAPGGRLAAPRVFMGLSHGDLEQAFLTTRHYMKRHVFPMPLKNSPWIVYDFWATEAEGVEEALNREIDFAAKLGVDVFNMDASWYQDSSRKGTGDWGCGLGHYSDDRQKYPSGLAAISRRVHEAGMKFGLWVGPNIVDSRIVGTLIPKQWVAQIDGKDQVLHIPDWEFPMDQVCLGCSEYIAFLKSELTRIIRDFDIDWLKWDNSGIPGSPAGCNRPDHGHQAGDGSYASLVGQYGIFDHLHATFPDLVLEQCGYGSRLDYGLARTIRSNWLSDASYPSDHVRNNAIVASHLYPSAYNGAWIVSEDPDLLREANDPAMLDTIFRSRMMSLFGFGTINGQLKERISLYPEPVLAAARRNVALYKSYRHLLQHDCYQLLPSGDVTPDKSNSEWQAVQFVSPSGQEAVVLAFRAESAQQTVQMPLRGLKSEGSYEVVFANAGRSSSSIGGGELSVKGITVSLERARMSEVVLVRMK